VHSIGQKTVGFVRASQIIANYFMPFNSGVRCKGHMRILSNFIFITSLLSGMACATEELLVYKISPECIESISINESNFAGYWNINIELTDSEGKSINSITQKNLGQKFVVVDALENDIGFPSATLQAPLSKKFRMAGFDSLDKAKDTKEQILTNIGVCGFAPNKLINKD
jgi:hypothetical protein